MTDPTIYLDFGEHHADARRYAVDDKTDPRTLRDLFTAYPGARSTEPLPPEWLDRSLADIRIRYLTIPEGEGYEVPQGDAAPRGRVDLSSVMAGKARKDTSGDGQRDDSAGGRADPVKFPDELKDEQAVAIAYDEDIQVVASFLRADLSVLVECDKNVVDHIYRPVMGYTGRKTVLDSEPEDTKGGEDGLEGLAAGGSVQLRHLEALLEDLKDHETLVLPFLDLLATGPESHLTNESRRLVELLYRHPKASLLGFVDPTVSVPPVVAARFPILVTLTGLPRCIRTPAGDQPALEYLTLAAERDRCEGFDAAAVFKHVAGFSPVQYRDAMRYLAATARSGRVSQGELLGLLQNFKRSSGDQAVQLPDKTFEDVGGYEDLIRELRQIAKLISGEPVEGVSETMRRRLLPRGLLLHGPPGSGKTLIAKALAHEMRATIQIVSGPEVMDMYVGESERRVRTLFNNARRNTPSVIIFDEFDAIATQRTEGPDGGSRAGNAVVAQLLTELDGFREDDSILVVATTNRIDIIDEALLRPSRFRPIEVSLPDPRARTEICRIHARAFEIADKLPQGTIELVAEYTEGLNGDELRAVFQEAASAMLLHGRKLDIELIGELVGRMRERRDQQTRRHLRDRRQRAAETAATGAVQDAQTPTPDTTGETDGDDADA